MCMNRKMLTELKEGLFRKMNVPRSQISNYSSAGTTKSAPLSEPEPSAQYSGVMSRIYRVVTFGVGATIVGECAMNIDGAEDVRERIWTEKQHQDAMELWTPF